MIRKDLAHDHVKSAIQHIAIREIPSKRNSVHYDLIYERVQYPPKYVISIACLLAFGSEPPSKSFNAVEAKNRLIKLGFTVVDNRMPNSEQVVSEDDEDTYPEGKEKYQTHKKYERNKVVIERVKRKRLAENGLLSCDVCGFDFVDKYGPAGNGFIEAHHKLPVSEMGENAKTLASDIALVCSNCHRMLHRGNSLRTINELKKMINQNSSS
nr:HNH endonuclease [FCB group bacterium]